MKPPVGLIGAGLMGHGIGKNIVEKGWPLTVLEPFRKDNAESLRRRGARVVDTAAEVAAASDIVILCVTGATQVEDLVYREDGLLNHARPGSIVLDCSTSEPSLTERVAADLKRRNVTFVDGPLSRTPPEAEKGILNILVGGDAATIARIRPVLEAFCEHIFHVGPTGDAHKLKLINNFMSMGIMAIAAEAYCACLKTGIDPHKWFELVSQGNMNSGLYQMMVGGALEGDMSRMKFFVANGLKDMTYYNRLTDEQGLMGPVAVAVRQSLKQAVALGFGDHYMAGMIEAQCRLNGVPFPRLIPD